MNWRRLAYCPLIHSSDNKIRILSEGLKIETKVSTELCNVQRLVEQHDSDDVTWKPVA